MGEPPRTVSWVIFSRPSGTELWRACDSDPGQSRCSKSSYYPGGSLVGDDGASDESNIKTPGGGCNDFLAPCDHFSSRTVSTENRPGARGGRCARPGAHWRAAMALPTPCACGPGRGHQHGWPGGGHVCDWPLS